MWPIHSLFSGSFVRSLVRSSYQIDKKKCFEPLLSSLGLNRTLTSLSLIDNGLDVRTANRLCAVQCSAVRTVRFMACCMCMCGVSRQRIRRLQELWLNPCSCARSSIYHFNVCYLFVCFLIIFFFEIPSLLFFSHY